MLRLFRTRAWCVVTAAVLAVGTTTAAFDKVLHAGGTHDVDCVPGLDVAHDGASHRFSATTDSTGADSHCLACHVARAPRLGAQTASAAGDVDDVGTHRPLASIGA
ncbi:MAG: hypothetical protein ACREUC_11730, partial [Steroidobacteraceae bacterium]